MFYSKVENMASKTQGTFLPSEVFFMAEDVEVTVIPRQSMDSLKLIGLRVPKLQPMRRAVVPLWLALLLKKQSRLNVVPPEWLTEENLKKVHEEEVSQPAFAKLPWHWMEVGQAILEGAPDDLGSPSHVIRDLLRDIREARQAKIRAGVKELNESHMRMDNVGLMEINEIRPFVSSVMDELRRYSDLEVGNDQGDEEE